MAKIMIFVDGTWLYSNTKKLAEEYGQKEYQVDFGNLPIVLANEIGKQLGSTEVDVVRTYLFGSYASNYDIRDDEAVQRRLDFFSMLKDEYHYELELFPINFRGRRLRRSDRDPQDTFEPKEKCVDISLATSMLYFAAIPYAYDIAIAVIGDQDFKPVLQHVRRLGKRTAIASIKGSCASEFFDPGDESRVKDFDIVWLNDLLSELELKREKHQLECQSPMHKGDRKVWTTYYPRRGQKFYCDECKTKFEIEKQKVQEQYVASSIEDMTTEEFETCQVGQDMTGKIKNTISDKGFGFIKGADDKDYFFHLTDLMPELEFENLQEGQLIEFEIKTKPSMDKAGSARNIRKRAS